MLAAITLLILYYLHAINFRWLIIITILADVIIWLISPWLTDKIQHWFYKATYYKEAEFTAKYSRLADFLKQRCQETKTPFPKIGIIDDDNPTAFSYGSGKWNSRIVFTQGILTYLEEDEVEAVLAHEFGHIVHRDFIVMSIASAIIQLLYEISYVLTDTTKRSSNNSKSNAAGAAVMIGYLAYIFYWIGSYIVLFLNRLREYYADEYSAESMQHSEPLENALVKIAYGIMAKEDTEAGTRLLKSTQTMGIMSLASAKYSAQAVKVANFEPDKVARVMLYDVVSPWAWLAQLSATHPLTGKRLLRLEKINAKFGKKPRYDLIAAKAASNYSRSRIWFSFWAGSFMYLLPGITVLALLISVPIIAVTKPDVHVLTPILYSLFPALLLLFLLRVMYMFPTTKKVGDDNIYDLMTDLYASPIRGRAIKLEGEIVGRGTPGYMFGEDMMLQDKTGLLYIDYKGAIPLISRLMVALKKLKDLIGKDVTAVGWFYRSNTQFMRLKRLTTPSGKLRSYPRLYSIFGAILMAALLSLVPLGIALAFNNNNLDILGDNKKIAARHAADNKPKVVDNACYQITVPSASSTTIGNAVSGTSPLIDQCPMYASYSANSDNAKIVFQVNLLAHSQRFSTFRAAGSDWERLQATSITADAPVNVHSLAAYRIMYSDPQYHQLTETYLIDSTSLIKKGGLSYYTEITSPYTPYNDAQLQKILNSLTIKLVNLDTAKTDATVVQQGLQH
jgi:Zn-dependent protease with chaperone function